MKELNSTNYKAVMMENGWKIVQFYSPVCVACRMNKQILENNETRLGAQVYLVNGLANSDLVKEYGVSKAPTVFIVDNNSNHTRLEDGLAGMQLVEAIKQTIGGK